MNWLFTRPLAPLFALLAGALLGYVAGSIFGVAAFGTVLGALICISVVTVVDTLRAYRLVDWLRGSQEGTAPRDAGLWGEVGYRIERTLRQRDLRLEDEKTRLGQFLTAMEASPNGLMMLNSSNHIQWCNSVAAHHFALDPVRDREQAVTNLVRSPPFVSALQEQRYDEAFRVPDPRGGGMLSMVIRAYGSGLKLVLSSDITERERADAMRRQFVANVSHEIRTPLTVLSGFIETMSNLTLTEAERRRMLMLMSQQAARMLTLVQDLLTLAQLEGSPRPDPDRWTPISGVLAQVGAEASALSAGRHKLNFPEHVEFDVAGAEGELLSAFGNLVNNAVRYTPEGGKVDVTWTINEDGSGELAVHDTGIGIDREHIPRLTERFYRVDGSRSRDTGGTGLGLSIVKHVAQRHGAEFDIQSEPEQGSHFRLTFPAARVRAHIAGKGERVELQDDRQQRAPVESRASGPAFSGVAGNLAATASLPSPAPSAAPVKGAVGGSLGGSTTNVVVGSNTRKLQSESSPDSADQRRS
ncbi:phosphate regulon sensor histidine kinase PhoR [soil metagenome]